MDNVTLDLLHWVGKQSFKAVMDTIAIWEVVPGKMKVTLKLPGPNQFHQVRRFIMRVLPAVVRRVVHEFAGIVITG